MGFTSGEMMHLWQYWSHKCENVKHLVKTAKVTMTPVLACLRVCTC